MRPWPSTHLPGFFRVCVIHNLRQLFLKILQRTHSIMLGNLSKVMLANQVPTPAQQVLGRGTTKLQQRQTGDFIRNVSEVEYGHQSLTNQGSTKWHQAKGRLEACPSSQQVGPGSFYLHNSPVASHKTAKCPCILICQYQAELNQEMAMFSPYLERPEVIQPHLWKTVFTRVTTKQIVNLQRATWHRQWLQTFASQLLNLAPLRPPSVVMSLKHTKAVPTFLMWS